MRCEHCGKNEATFHVQSVVNGRAEEAHLCAHCAEELGYAEPFEGGLGRMFSEPFGSVFSFLPSMFGTLDGFFDEPQLTPAARRTLQLTPAPDQPRYETESLLDETEGAALRRECERNSLNVRLREAVEAEDYEQAAKLRDALRRLDGESA